MLGAYDCSDADRLPFRREEKSFVAALFRMTARAAIESIQKQSQRQLQIRTDINRCPVR